MGCEHEAYLSALYTHPQDYPSMMTDVLSQLITSYDDAPACSRAGAARTIAEAAPLFSPVHVDTVLRFLLTRYVCGHV